MKNLTCAVIGCGVIAPTHLKAVVELDGVDVKYLCDIDESRAQKMLEEFGVGEVVADYKIVLADDEVDFVLVLTDHKSHAQITIDAIEAGKHVLCEKALCACKEDMAEVVRVSKANPEILVSSIFQHRFEPTTRFLKKLVDEKRLGKILYATVLHNCFRGNEYYEKDPWRGSWELEGGGVSINQSVHFIDVLTWIMGGVDQLSAFHANIAHTGVIETEDVATASLLFKSGALGTINVTNGSCLDWDWSVMLNGTEGVVEIRNYEPLRIEFKDKEVETQVKKELGEVENAEHEQSSTAGKKYYGKGHLAQIADFADAIRSGEQPFISLESAAHSVDVVHSIYHSFAEGKSIKVNYES